jgi:hypothetical protein
VKNAEEERSEEDQRMRERGVSDRGGDVGKVERQQKGEEEEV